jgi:hypothetical protein
MALKESKYSNSNVLKGGAVFNITNKKMSPLKCHSLDCVPNVFKFLGITNKETSKFLASLYKKGIPHHIVYRFLNEEFKKKHLDETIYTIKDGQYRRFTEIECILELKNMEEYAKSIIKINTALMGIVVYIHSEIHHLMVVANIDNDIYLLDPQLNLTFNISQFVRENNYPKELLRYIKPIIKISVIINISTEYESKYTKPFFSELLKYSLLHGQNKDAPLDMNKLKIGYKYQIIPNNKQGPILFGTFHSFVDGVPIFYIKGELQSIVSQKHKFVEFVSRSAPTRSKSKSKSKSITKFLDVTQLEPGEKYQLIPYNKKETPLVGIFHLIEEGFAIFDIDTIREEINPSEYQFIKVTKKKLYSHRNTIPRNTMSAP